MKSKVDAADITFSGNLCGFTIPGFRLHYFCIYIYSTTIFFFFKVFLSYHLYYVVYFCSGFQNKDTGSNFGSLKV